MEFLLPQVLVITLDFMVTVSLWLNFKSSRSTYLAIACGAGVLEILRQLVDSLLVLLPGFLSSGFLLSSTTALQFFSSIVFLYALRQAYAGGFKIPYLMETLIALSIAAIIYRQTSSFDRSVFSWYLFYTPLLISSLLTIWWAKPVCRRWASSQIILFMCAVALLLIRVWLPTHIVFDSLFLMVYHSETLIYAFMLGSLSLIAMERAQRRVKLLLDDFMQSEEDLQFILDHSADTILITDDKGLLSYWSLKCEEKFGYTREEAISHLSFNSLMVDDSSPDEVNESTGVEGFEADMYQADGSIFKAKARVQTVRRNGSLYRIFVIQDISVQHELEKQQAILDRQAESAKKLDSIGVLAGGIAHDFNNILTGIFGNLSLARGQLSPDQPARKYLERAEISMDQATRLSDQLLTFAKGGEPMKEHLDLAEEVEEILRFHLAGTNVLPVVNKAKDLWLVEADKGQVQQIFSNLMINANHAMPNGGHLFFNMENANIPDTKVHTLSAGKYVRISIRDEGVGIEERYLEQIFEPYFSTKQDGSGLGLTTVFSIVSRHGGHISVESELGQGTTFSMYLPACNSRIMRHDKKQNIHCTTEPENTRILVMDDDEEICEIISQTLEGAGYSVDIVTGGEDAIESYKRSMNSERKFSLVILDLTIPGGMGGKEVVKQLLHLDEDANVMVSSGYADDPVLSHYADYGFKSRIAKPYTIKGLENAVREALAQQQLVIHSVNSALDYDVRS